MSILETFYILFKTDADEAAKDIKKVDDASDKAANGLKKMDAAAGGVGAAFKKMALAIAGPLLTLATAKAALSVAVERAAAVRELDQFSSKLNSSIESVDAFQRAVKGMGGETAGALDSLVKIGEKVNEAFSDAGSGAAKDFKAWGLAFKDAKGQALGASDAMLALAKNLEGVSRAEALARIKKLGIEDAATIDLILKGRNALEDRLKAEIELGVITKEQAENVRKYYGELGRAQNVMTSLGNTILGLFLPGMTKTLAVLGDFAEWARRNGTLVAGFFMGVAGAITLFYLPAITAAAAATLAATWPFLAIAAAIAAIGVAVALAFEDVMAFLNGQPSLIGALAEKYWIVQAVIDNIAGRYRALKMVATAVLKGISAAWDWLTGASEAYSNKTREFWSTFQPIWEGIKELVSSVGDLFTAIGERISSDLEAPIKRIKTRFVEAKDAVVKFFEQIFGDSAKVGSAATDAASAFKNVFAAAFEFVKSVWDNTVGLIAGKIQGLAASIRGLAGDVAAGGESPPAPANDNLAAAGSSIGAMMGAGKTATAAASGAAINSAAAGGVNVANTSNVTVGSVTVNTQATDAAAVAGAVRGELQKQLRGTAAQFDDGVAR